MLPGLVDIDGNCVDLLNALFLYSKIYFSNKGMFLVVGGYGNTFGHGGSLRSDWLLLLFLGGAPTSITFSVYLSVHPSICLLHTISQEPYII